MHISNIGSAIIIRDLLSKSDRNSILEYAVENADRFVSSTVTSGDLSYRKSKVIYNFDPWQTLITDQVRSLLPDVCDRLSIPRFEPSQIECQMTSTGHGGYFKIHTDSLDEQTKTREVSWIYYVREPDGFRGGLLKFYRSGTVKDVDVSIAPVDNSLLMFRSDTWHSVGTVFYPRDDIAGSRITCNGWCRK